MLDAMNQQLEELDKQLSVVETEAKRIKSLIKLINKTMKDYNRINEGGTENECEDQRQEV